MLDDRLGPVEVVLELGALVFLAGHERRPHRALRPVELPERRPRGRVVAEPLREDVAGAGERGLGVRHIPFGAHERRRLIERPDGRLVREDRRRQRLEAGFSRDRGARAALRAIRRVDVFERRHRLGGGHGGRQLVGEEVPLLERPEDRGTPIVEVGQLRQPVADGGDRHLVQAPGGLLAVPRDEGHRGAFGQERRGGGDLARRHAQFRRRSSRRRLRSPWLLQAPVIVASNRAADYHREGICGPISAPATRERDPMNGILRQHKP